MAFLSQGSPECEKFEMKLFSLPPTLTVIERGQLIEFHPLANVLHGEPLEFYLEAEKNISTFHKPIVCHRKNFKL